jgi:hypothetical protein
MHHVKLIVLGVVLAGVIIFGFIFWDDFKFNQEELSNTPLPPSPLVEDSGSAMVPPQGQQESGTGTQDLNSGDDYDSLEKDLVNTDLEIDSELTEIESEMSGL